MTRPNIDMITASLRNCSLRRGRREPKPPPLPRRQQRRHLVEDSDEIAGVSVELNSGAALPYNWEQYLDMRTGEIYYINWETGIRTTEDPRNSTIASSYSDEGEASDDEDSGSSYDASGETTGSSYDASGETTGSSYDASGDTPGSSSLSSASSTETSASVDDVGSGGHVLVAAGCRACFTYFMVPKRAHVCPSCGGRLFHLRNNGSS